MSLRIQHLGARHQRSFETLHTWNRPLSLKSELRIILLNQRRNLTPKQHDDGAEYALQLLEKHPLLKKASKIGFYRALAGELNLWKVFEMCLLRGQRCYFPVCHEQQLNWIEVNQTSPWRKNQFGIFEPESGTIESIGQLDCILVPCVGCDPQHRRLGHGQGFYDRALKGVGNPPWLIGVLYDIQLCPLIPHDPWDIPMNELCIIPTA